MTGFTKILLLLFIIVIRFTISIVIISIIILKKGAHVTATWSALMGVSLNYIFMLIIKIC